MCNKETRCCLHRRDRRNRRHENIPQCCYDNMTELLKNIATILNKNEMHWWVDWGSLLGILRSGKLTPWDGDLDIGILQHDSHKMNLLAPEFAALGHYYCPRSCLNYTGHRSMHQRIFFSKKNLLYADVNSWLLRGDRAIGCGTQNEGGAEFYTTLDTFDFQGVTLKIPSKAEEYIALRYGPTWREAEPYYYKNSGHLRRYKLYKEYRAKRDEELKNKGPHGPLWL